MRRSRWILQTRAGAAITVAALGALTLCACGTPAERDGQGRGFDRASMVGGGGSSSSGAKGTVAAEPISWLVSFNRLHTADALEKALNKKPGQFSSIDQDRDGVVDPLVVRKLSHDDGPAFELTARAGNGKQRVVSTLLFDDSWSFMGSYNGAMPGAPPLPAAPAPAPAPTPAPAIAAAPPAAPAPAGAGVGTPALADTKDHSKDIAMEPISWLVRFNKLHTAKSIEEAINGTPGQFSKVDTDTDGAPDYISVAERSHTKGRAFELRAKPAAKASASANGVVVATMLFDNSWSLVGWYNGVAPSG